MNYLTRAHTAKDCDQCGEELDGERIYVPKVAADDGGRSFRDECADEDNVLCAACASEVAELVQERGWSYQFLAVTAFNPEQRALPIGSGIGCGIPLYSNLTVA